MHWLQLLLLHKAGGGSAYKKKILRLFFLLCALLALLLPLWVGCSKQTSKTYAFFAYSFTSFDNQIRGKVDISPFFDMAMSTCFQSFFEIEINSSDFISKMKT